MARRNRLTYWRSLKLLRVEEQEATAVSTTRTSIGTGGSGGGLNTWQTKTADYTMSAGDRIVIDTTDSARTLTLPASPTFSDEVYVLDAGNNAAVNNITIAANGSKILASDSDLTINVNRASIAMMYHSDSQGWILTSAF